MPPSFSAPDGGEFFCAKRKKIADCLKTSLCETDSPDTGEVALAPEGERCPEGAEGENLAIARNISGDRTALSPTACGRSPLAEGAKGGAHLFRHAGIFLCFAQKKSQHHGRGRACPARGLTESARLRETTPGGYRIRPYGKSLPPLLRCVCGTGYRGRTSRKPIFQQQPPPVVENLPGGRRFIARK